MDILKRKEFNRWQVAEKLDDEALCQAVQEMNAGLVDADLGGQLFKKRIARRGAGKRSGYRTILSARIGEKYVFLHGFAKNAKSNLTRKERAALQFAGQAFLDLSGEKLTKAIRIGVLQEVSCDEQNY